MNAHSESQNQAVRLSSNLGRLLLEFGRDFERRALEKLHQRGHRLVRGSHFSVFSNLGLGAVRVTELAERARVTQQAMGKMLKELERIGYVVRAEDSNDKRAKQIQLTDRGQELMADSTEVMDEVRAEYAEQVGDAELHELERQLANCMHALELDYLPSSWLDSVLAAQASAGTLTAGPEH